MCTGSSQLSSLVSIALSTPLLHLPPPEALISQLYVRKDDGRLLLGGLDLSGPPSSGSRQGQGEGGGGLSSKSDVSVADLPRLLHAVLATLLSVSRTVYLVPNPHTPTSNNNSNSNNNSHNGTNNKNHNDDTNTGDNGNDGSDGTIQKTCYIQAGHQLYLSFLDSPPPLGKHEIRLIDPSSSSNSSSSKDNKNINPTHSSSSTSGNNSGVIEVQYNTVNLSGDRDRSIATLTTHTTSPTAHTSINISTNSSSTIGAGPYICIDTHKEGRILIDITAISPPYTTTSNLSRRNEVASYRYELLIVITPSLTPLYRQVPPDADTEKGHNSDPSIIILSTKVLELLSYLKQAHHTNNYSLLMSAQALLPPSIGTSTSSNSSSSGNTSIKQQLEIARLWRDLIEG